MKERQLGIYSEAITILAVEFPLKLPHQLMRSDPAADLIFQ